MAENKSQHYVPQLYLRYFSKDDKNIKIYPIRNKKIVIGSISGQCCSDYFYSKDLKHEHTISELEGESKRVIDQIIKTQHIPTRKDKENSLLYFYVLHQNCRTLKAADKQDEFTDEILKIYLKLSIEAKKPDGITSEAIDKSKISMKEPALFNLSILGDEYILARDLECKLIINNCSTEFITSDNPVVLYNKYYLKSDRSYTGIACKGLLIIFPLTPRYLLIFYDSKIYKIGGKRLHTLVTLQNSKDVDELNILQMINANKTIYTLNNNETYLNNLSTISEKYRNIKFPINEIPIINKNKKLLLYKKPKITYDIKTTFVNINKKIPEYYKTKDIVRNPFIVSLYDEFKEKVKDKTYKMSEFSKFIKDKAASLGNPFNGNQL